MTVTTRVDPCVGRSWQLAKRFECRFLSSIGPDGLALFLAFHQQVDKRAHFRRTKAGRREYCGDTASGQLPLWKDVYQAPRGKVACNRVIGEDGQARAFGAQLHIKQLVLRWITNAAAG